MPLRGTTYYSFFFHHPEGDSEADEMQDEQGEGDTVIEADIDLHRAKHIGTGAIGTWRAQRVTEGHRGLRG